MNGGLDFVKAATTSTPAEKSQGDIIAMLHRYRASGFGFRARGSLVAVSFHIPKEGGADTTVEIPIDVERVHERLNGLQRAKRSHGRHVAATVDRAQAERVAWRILYLWIDAALAAVSIGAQSIEEAFFAHLIVENTDGQSGRVIDYVHTLQEGAGGQLPAPRLLLGSGGAPR